MKRAPRFEPARFLPYVDAMRHNPPPDAVRIDVSSEGEDPFNLLSPMHPHGEISVPGMPNTYADSVEGIWQGLKVIRGKTAARYFNGAGKKRGGKPTGHRFGTTKRLLGLEAARVRIYIPAYEWMLENRVPPEILEMLRAHMRAGTMLFLYDRANGGSVTKDIPLAHAAVLVKWLNRTT